MYIFRYLFENGALFGLLWAPNELPAYISFCCVSFVHFSVVAFGFAVGSVVLAML